MQLHEQYLLNPCMSIRERRQFLERFIFIAQDVSLTFPNRLGQPGVDVHVRHDMDGPPGSAAVLHLQFLVNEGALISATADDTLHLWNFRQKIPQIVQSLKFQKEKCVLHKSFVGTIFHLCLFQDYLHASSVAIKVVVCGHGEGKRACSANRKF